MTRRRIAIAFGAVVVLVAASLVVWKYVLYSDGDRPGSAFELSIGDRHVHEVALQLPIGQLEIATGTPTDELRDGIDDRSAADGAVYVPITWQLTGGDFSFYNEPVYQFDVVLVADGRRYDLQAGQGEDASPTTPVLVQKSLYAVVQGDGSNLKVEVGYDGVVQTADLDTGKITPGLAAPYYPTGRTPTTLPQRTCELLPATDRTTLEPSVGRCTVKADLAPHVGGLGWVSSSSQSWVLVSVDVLASEIRGRSDDSRYDVISARVAVGIDGARPVRDILRYRSGLSVNRGDVFVLRASAHPKMLYLTTILITRNLINDVERTFRVDTVYPLS